MIPISLGEVTVDVALNSGGQSVIWHGRRVRDDASVVVKVLAAEHVGDARHREAIASEARQLARLRHPHIIRILGSGAISAEHARPEVGLCQGAPFLIVEHAALSFEQQLTEQSRWGELKDALLAILDALAYAHARGVIHRDLKPSNIRFCDLTSARAGLRLLDFGLAIAEPDTDPMFGLSPHYAAPEQFLPERWRDIGPWTDLYALGCVATELINGAPPFTNPHGDLHWFRQMHTSIDPPALGPRPGVPAALQLWVHRLLQKSPQDRFVCAADARAALESIETLSLRPRPRPRRRDRARTWTDTTRPRREPPTSLPASAAPIPAAPPEHDIERVEPGRSLHSLQPFPLIAREAEQKELWEILTGVWQDRSAALVAITGDAGLGKTALARWLAESAAEAGAAVSLLVQYDHSTTEALSAMLRAHLRASGLSGAALRQHLAAMQPLGSSDIDGLFRLLSGSDTSQPADRYTLLARLLLRLSRDRPVLLRMEDIHHSPDAPALIQTLLRNVPGLLIVATARTALPEELKPAARTFALQPLSDAQIGALLDSRLPMAPELRAQLIQRSEKNPLAAVLLAEALADLDGLVRSAAGIRLPHPERLTLPEELQALWRHRLDQRIGPVSEPARQALWLAAALGRQVQDADWKAAWAVWKPQTPVPAVQAPMLSAGLMIRQAPTSWSFSEIQLWETLKQEALEQGQWSAVNQACVAVLRDQQGALARLGPHLLAAGALEESISCLLEGARQRMEATDYPAVQGLLGHLRAALARLDVAPTDPRSLSMELLDIQLALSQERTTDAVAQAIKTVQKSSTAPPHIRCRVTRYLGMALRKREQTPEHQPPDHLSGEAWLNWAEQQARDGGLAWELARCQLHRGSAARFRQDLAGAIRLMERAREGFAQLDDALGLADVNQELGTTLLMRAESGPGSDQDLAAAAEALLAAEAGYEALGRKTSAAQTWNALGVSYRRQGRLEEAEDFLSRALAQFEMVRSAKSNMTLLNLGYIALQTGRFEDGTQWLTALLEREDLRRSTVLYARCGLLLCAAARQDTPEERRLLGLILPVMLGTDRRPPECVWAIQEAHAHSLLPTEYEPLMAGLLPARPRSSV